MGNIAQSPNHREVLSAISTITGKQEYLNSTNGALDITGGGSGGGGTQYASGTTTPGTVTGNALIFDNSGTLEDVSVANPLPVAATFSGTLTSSPTFAQNPGAGTPAPAYGLIDSSYRPQVSVATALPAGTNAIGSVTNTAFIANAGTNLNTSLLALESGGNLATLAETVTSSKVQVNVTNASLPVTGTFWQTTQPISAVSLPLPAGASTAAKQPALGTAGTASTDVLTIQGITSMIPLKVDGSGVTQPISASSLPLPTGAATSINQTNASQKTQLVDGSGNVIAATSNALDVYITGGGNGGMQYQELATTTSATGTLALGRYQSSLPALTTGQMNEPMLDSSSRLYVNVANTSVSVTGTFWQTTQPVSLSSTTITGTVAVTESGTWNVGLNAGSNAIGSITNTSFAATQTTAANLNATVVGTGTFAVQAAQSGTWNTRTQDGSGNVITSTNGSLNIVQQASTSTLTNVSASVTSVTLLSSNISRKAGEIYNDSTAICYVKFGTTASATSFTVPLAAATYYEIPGGYTGRIDAIWVTATGTARVTELT